MPERAPPPLGSETTPEAPDPPLKTRRLGWAQPPRPPRAFASSISLFQLSLHHAAPLPPSSHTGIASRRTIRVGDRPDIGRTTHLVPHAVGRNWARLPNADVPRPRALRTSLMLESPVSAANAGRSTMAHLLANRRVLLTRRARVGFRRKHRRASDVPLPVPLRGRGPRRSTAVHCEARRPKSP